MKKVRIAYLQSAIMIPGTKLGGDVTLSVDKDKSLEMTYDDSFLYIKANKKQSVVPLVNVKNLILADEK